MNSVTWSLIGVLCLVTLCLGYSNISSVCGDFAEKLQRNATNAGLKCGFVEVNFVESNTEHACNVFDTTDRGYIFVDDSGEVDAFVKIEQLSAYKPYVDDGSYIFEPVGMIDHVTIWWSDWNSAKYCYI